MTAPRPALDEPEVPDLSFELAITRMRRRLAEADLDCPCREEIETGLDDLAAANAQVAFLTGLAQARAMREAIAKLTGYLADLDELDAGEDDLSAFVEMVGLFEDITQAADSGAAAMRTAVASHPCHSPGNTRDAR